jgi:hypothetical protein
MTQRAAKGVFVSQPVCREWRSLHTVKTVDTVKTGPNQVPKVGVPIPGTGAGSATETVPGVPTQVELPVSSAEEAEPRAAGVPTGDNREPRTGRKLPVVEQREKMGERRLVETRKLFEDHQADRAKTEYVRGVSQADIESFWENRALRALDRRREFSRAWCAARRNFRYKLEGEHLDVRSMDQGLRESRLAWMDECFARDAAVASVSDAHRIPQDAAHLEFLRVWVEDPNYEIRGRLSAWECSVPDIAKRSGLFISLFEEVVRHMGGPVGPGLDDDEDYYGMGPEDDDIRDLPDIYDEDWSDRVNLDDYEEDEDLDEDLDEDDDEEDLEEDDDEEDLEEDDDEEDLEEDDDEEDLEEDDDDEDDYYVPDAVLNEAYLEEDDDDEDYYDVDDEVLNEEDREDLDEDDREDSMKLRRYIVGQARGWMGRLAQW